MDRFGESEEHRCLIILTFKGCSWFITGVVIPVDGGFNAYSGV